MKQKFVTFMLALLATTALFAQTKVTGTVTDLDGNYVITVKPIGNSEEIIDLMKKAWFTSAEGYTLDTVYHSAPKF